MGERSGSQPPRIEREKRTIRAMIEIYCRAHHGARDGVCVECAALREYALGRLERCPFGAEKTTCADCSIHCYKPQMRDQVRAVMRYAGPRMLLRHPILALWHQWDAWRGGGRAAPARKAQPSAAENSPAPAPVAEKEGPRMSRQKRLIVQIDPEKCDGCGLCVPSCAEGAIQIRQGKAELVADVYCDGLGACLGHCPHGAITVIEREAEAFDEEAAQRHVAELAQSGSAAAASAAHAAATSPAAGAACPGVRAQTFALNVLSNGPAPAAATSGGEDSASALSHWPIQLRLVPADAPYLQGADLLLVADCVPFALADFHQRFLRGRPVVIGCPKLDDGQFYVQKLTAMLQASSIRSLAVLHMEVPCCTGLVRIAEAALRASGKTVPLEDVVVSIRGRVGGRDVGGGE